MNADVSHQQAPALQRRVAGGQAGAVRASIIIPHYNMPERLTLCLNSVRAQNLEDEIEIIVVDNGSSLPPDPVSIASAGARLVFEPASGPGHARNTGAKAAASDILIFIDADCCAAPGWLAAAIAAVDARADAGAIGGDIQLLPVDPHRPTAIECYESEFGFRQKLYIEKKSFSCTANLAMHRRVFDKVGPFAGIDIAEDVDWGRRAAACGLPVRYDANMRVFHPARTSLKALMEKWRRHVAHDWAAHVAHGSPAWRWLLPMILMVPSILVDGVRLIARAPVGTFVQRCRGVGILAAVRWQRARWMWACWRGASASATDSWRSVQ